MSKPTNHRKHHFLLAAAHAVMAGIALLDNGLLIALPELLIGMTYLHLALKDRA